MPPPILAHLAFSLVSLVQPVTLVSTVTLVSGSFLIPLHLCIINLELARLILDLIYFKTSIFVSPLCLVACHNLRR
ncbi:hypothetical protein B0F90DRAFT_1754960 [Multifurca ochricompacta]|uniref:Uncharacterized protein n=1 Tax=Multifurca ochricompacta TaxID=376703 RepID=A0AAD4LYS5_9AGAM|nr:hypothetical protein B0F90DRAFT_1754960 [Multifurca ochricompacta]